jgi:hypothetical protein
MFRFDLASNDSNISSENKFNYNAKAPRFFQNSFKNINKKGNYWTSTNITTPINRITPTNTITLSALFA